MNFSPALFTNPTTSFSPKTHNYISLHPTTHPPLVVVLQPPSALQNTTKRTDRAALAPLTHTHTYLRLLIRARCYFSPDNRARNTAPLISSPLSLSLPLSRFASGGRLTWSLHRRRRGRSHAPALACENRNTFEFSRSDRVRIEKIRKLT